MNNRTININFRNTGNILQKKHPEIDFALIFGSSKDGKVNIKSDIDLAVWFGRNYDEDSVLNLIKTVESLYPEVECDLAILNTSGIFLQFEALKGKVLFIRKGKEENYAEFYSKTCRKHEDQFFWMQRQLQYRGYDWNLKVAENEI